MPVILSKENIVIVLVLIVSYVHVYMSIQCRFNALIQ